MAVKILTIHNPDVKDNEITRIASNYTGGTTLKVENGSDFSADDLIVVGEPGHEKTEGGQVSGATADTLTLSSTLNYSHSKDVPVYKARFDQIEVSYNDGSSWSTFSGMPINVQWDGVGGGKSVTEYETPDGSYTTFRWRFYNSVTSTYSSYSPSLPSGGWPRNSVGHLVEMVRNFTRDPQGEYAGIEEILEYFNDAQDIIRFGGRDARRSTGPVQWWFLRHEPSSWTSTEASTYKYALPSNLNHLEFILYHYTHGTAEDTIYRLRPKGRAKFDSLHASQTQDDDDQVGYYTILPPDGNNVEGYAGFYPTPETANQEFKFVYFKDMDALDSMNDTTLVPKPQLLAYYASEIILFNENQENRAGRYANLFDAGIKGLKSSNRKVLKPIQFKFRGQRGHSRLYDGKRTDRDTLHINYFEDER